MGPYCDYCDHRCFVPNPRRGEWVTILATCPGGKAHDLEALGYCADTPTPEELNRAEIVGFRDRSPIRRHPASTSGSSTQEGSA